LTFEPLDNFSCIESSISGLIGYTTGVKSSFYSNILFYVEKLELLLLFELKPLALQVKNKDIKATKTSKFNLTKNELCP
jgi:hypothetical protein